MGFLLGFTDCDVPLHAPSYHTMTPVELLIIKDYSTATLEKPAQLDAHRQMKKQTSEPASDRTDAVFAESSTRAVELGRRSGWSSPSLACCVDKQQSHWRWLFIKRQKEPNPCLLWILKGNSQVRMHRTEPLVY